MVDSAPAAVVDESGLRCRSRTFQETFMVWHFGALSFWRLVHKHHKTNKTTPLSYVVSPCGAQQGHLYGCTATQKLEENKTSPKTEFWNVLIVSLKKCCSPTKRLHEISSKAPQSPHSTSARSQPLGRLLWHPLERISVEPVTVWSTHPAHPERPGITETSKNLSSSGKDFTFSSGSKKHLKKHQASEDLKLIHLMFWSFCLNISETWSSLHTPCWTAAWVQFLEPGPCEGWNSFSCARANVWNTAKHHTKCLTVWHFIAWETKKDMAFAQKSCF